MHEARILRDIMSTDVVTVEPDATLRHVAELFSMQGISGAPVVSEGRVLGVISATDLVDFAASTPGTLPDVPPARPSAARVRHGWEAEPPADFHTEWELKHGDGGGGPADSRAAAADELNERLVRDLMSRGVRALPADTGLHEAAHYMLEHGVHRVLVMEGDELVGLVSALDFLRALAERRL